MANEQEVVTTNTVRTIWKVAGVVALMAAQWFGIRAEVNGLKDSIVALGVAQTASGAVIERLRETVHQLQVEVAVLRRDEDRRGQK